jgi:hypothetical protein
MSELFDIHETLEEDLAVVRVSCARVGPVEIFTLRGI